MIEKINPTIPIPITSSPIPDEQREIIMAKSSIAIPNPIFFIVNPPLQMPILMSLLYHNDTIIKKEKELLRALLIQFCKLEFLDAYNMRKKLNSILNIVLSFTAIL